MPTIYSGQKRVHKELQKCIKESGTKQQQKAIQTAQKNSVVERTNQIIAEKAKSILFGTELLKMYWAEAV